MSIYIFYDSTGAITKTLKIANCPADQAVALAKANAPAGTTPLAVAEGHPALFSPSTYAVKAGTLTVKPAPAGTTAS